MEDVTGQRKRARVIDLREVGVPGEQVMNRKIKMPPGRHAIHFYIRVPEDELHSFTYVSPKDGSMIINHYSIKATAQMNGITESTDRLSFQVLSVNDSKGSVGLVDSNNFVCVISHFASAVCALVCMGDTTTSRGKGLVSSENPVMCFVLSFSLSVSLSLSLPHVGAESDGTDVPSRGIPKKILRRTDGLSFALAQTTDGYYPQYESIEAVVLRRTKFPSTGEEDEEQTVTPTLKLLPQTSPTASSVVSTYRKVTGKSAEVPSKFTQFFESKNWKLASQKPSVWCEDFVCDYYLRLHLDNINEGVGWHFLAHLLQLASDVGCSAGSSEAFWE
ncbi:unnamed protein product [Schistocephalus solidus]|uniref:Cadherin domain-containing protein n=1 Tax=Schistocephalus solidus TaxID=70667 RepID=A0A183S8R7_SCHSO|nr:unnamed protein product [Schistocephalus solidus]